MDENKDFWGIEFSADSGTTWHEMNQSYIDTSFQYDHGDGEYTEGTSGWVFDKSPIYTGISNGWESQRLDIFVCSVYHPKKEELNGIIDCDPKSLWLKFVFASDSIYDDMDGWAIDDFKIREQYYVGTTDLENTLFQLAPNPAADILTLSFQEPITKSL